MLLEIDFAKKKKKPAPALATVTPIRNHMATMGSPCKSRQKKKDEHLTLSI